MDDGRPGSAVVGGSQGIARHLGMPGEDGVDAAPEMAHAFAVDNAQFKQAAFLAGGQPVGQQSAQVARTEGVQIQNSIHGQFDGGIAWRKFA